MERIISSRDPDLEESFSFSSCYDFNSSVFFSDDDDEYLEIHADDDESYIEIALDRDGDGEDDEGEPREFELRISFSTHNYLKDPKKIQQNQLLDSSTCSGPCPPPPPPPPSPPPPVVVSGKLRNQFPAVNRFVNTFMLSLGFSSQMADQNGPPHQNQLEHVSRKTSKRTMEMNGGITNLLIKFRGIKARTLLSPFVKPRQVISSQDKKKKKKKKKNSKETLQYSYRKLIKPLEKWLVQKNQGKGSDSNIIINDMKNCSGTGSGEKSRVMEINLDAIRGVLQVMRMSSSSSSGRKDKKTTSCPSSVKSSPVHKTSPSETKKLDSSENSIQAAIAHCKTSFGQTSDLRF